MANHKSSVKRIRSDKKKYERNRYQLKSTRTFIRKLRETSDKKEAQELLPKVSSMLDKLSNKNIIHRKNAAHKKSKLAAYVNTLQ